MISEGSCDTGVMMLNILNIKNINIFILKIYINQLFKNIFKLINNITNYSIIIHY